MKRLSAEADELAGGVRLTAALAVWRQVLELLPSETRQHQIVVARIAALRDRVDALGYRENEEELPPRAAPTSSSPMADCKPNESGSVDSRVGTSHVQQRTGILGVVGVAIWKFKFALLAAGSKLKFLLLGFSKSTTLLSMLVYLGPCWAAWGWKFGFGIVLSIYVHEMGHVAALTRYGISASAPMFIPGLGALVRLHQYPSDAIEDARIGLAGPIWGFGAALAAWGAALATGHALFAAVAKFGAWINLFNLVPFWQLDGGRGFRALSRGYRLLAVAGTGLALAVTHEGLLALIVVAGVLRALSQDCPAVGGKRALAEYLFLIAGLSLLNSIPVAIP